MTAIAVWPEWTWTCDDCGANDTGFDTEEEVLRAGRTHTCDDEEG